MTDPKDLDLHADSGNHFEHEWEAMNLEDDPGDSQSNTTYQTFND